MRHPVLLAAACFAAPALADPVQLTHSDYARAERFLPSNYAKYVDNGDIAHHWIAGQDRFWYVRTNDRHEREFVVVDAATGKRGPAFDHQIVADGLSALLKTKISPAALPFGLFRFTADGKAIEAFGGPVILTCQLAAPDCRSAPAHVFDEVRSPDGKLAAFLRGDNLWIRSLADGHETALTTDGRQYHGYGTLQGVAINHLRLIRLGIPDAPRVLWSPDSKRLLSYRMDERNVKLQHLVQAVPDDGSMRPKLWSFPYAMPGDDNRARIEPIVFDVATKTQVKVRTQPWFATHLPPFQRHEAWWTADGKHLYFLDNDEYFKKTSLNLADAATGATRQVIEETSATFVQLATDIADYPVFKTLSNGDLLWYSEATGWGRLYLIDGKTGRVRNPITKDGWTVRGISYVDERRRLVYFTGSGRDSGDVYRRDLYVVKFDGSGLRRLTPEQADHALPHEGAAALLAPLPFLPEADRDRFSPSGRYFVDSYSTPNQPPVFVVRRADGSLVKALEKADISRLEAGGYTPVESFEVLAADGKSRLFGNLYRPSNFDPARKYPVIDSIYPGPQFMRVGKTFKTALYGGLDGSGEQALAELGFIVVTIDGRGTPGRAKTFQDYGYNRPEKSSDLDDHIAGLRQLAARYPQIDLTRVGAEGVSGGGFATARALLAYPDFYKVGVAAAGNHEQRAYAAPFWDIYIGAPDQSGYVTGSNPPLAGNLKGKLLLVTGDMDDNVSLTLTLKLADALIKANKDFDLLVVPNADHSVTYNAYETRREWDYFVRNLAGAIPPVEYKIGGAK